MKKFKILSLISSFVALTLSAGCCKKCTTQICTNPIEPKALTLSADVEKAYSSFSSFKAVFDYIKKTDLTKLPDGKYDIDGDNAFVKVFDCKKRQQKDAFLEAHKDYIDLQYMIKGTETMGLKSTKDCKTVKDAYSKEEDIMFFSDSYDKFATIKTGEFIILFPSDAHAPDIGMAPTRKAVFKIKVSK